MTTLRTFLARIRQDRRLLAATVVVTVLVLAAVADLPARLGDIAPTGTTQAQPTPPSSAPPTPEPATLSNLVRDDNAELDQCTPNAKALAKCGLAPALRDGTWLNTDDGKDVTLEDLRGDVVLVDFFAASCANCRRDSRYVRAWEAQYREAGLKIIGVHVPEFDFEKRSDALTASLRDLSVRFPVLQDNALSTLTRYRSQVLPSKYLIDRTGTVRAISFGEGGYERLEGQIRAVLTAGQPGSTLPRPVGLLRDGADVAPGTTAQINLGDSRGARYDTESDSTVGRDTRFRLPPTQPDGTFSFGGVWRLESKVATPRAEAQARVTFRARKAYQLVGGKGTLEVTMSDGTRRTVKVDGPADLVQVYGAPTNDPETLTVRYTGSLQVYAFSFG